MTTLAALLAQAGHDDAALLLAYVLRRDRVWLVAHADFEPSQADVRVFEALCGRRHAGEPLAYLTGSAWFYGREFVVNDAVLVPRPETEHLIDETLRFIHGSMRVLDVGTGSGAIACTIAAETFAIVDATDISHEALEVARDNANRLGVADRVGFFQGDLVEPVRNRRYDVVVANLPYVPTSDLPEPPDPVSFEPRIATDGGPDGLAQYRRLMPALPELINDGGMILLEAAPPTINALAEMLRSILPDFTISVVKDYSGLDRYVKARYGPAKDCCMLVEGHLNPRGLTYRSRGV